MGGKKENTPHALPPFLYVLQRALLDLELDAACHCTSGPNSYYLARCWDMGMLSGVIRRVQRELCTPRNRGPDMFSLVYAGQVLLVICGSALGWVLYSRSFAYF